MAKNILDFYLETSTYTYLGPYSDLVKNIPNDIKELCLLLRMQTIHPIAFNNPLIRSSNNCFWGNMQEIPDDKTIRQDDILPNSMSMLSELLRINPNLSPTRKAKDKIIVTCRGISLLLASILKYQNVPARLRSGFANYPSNDGIFWDHWVVEYYNETKKRWILVDADCCANEGIYFDIFDVPKDKFIPAPNLWLAYRHNNFDINKLGHAYYGCGEEKICETLLTAIFYDFHCLMNNEVIYLHYPKYLRDRNFSLSEEELEEIDNLATLMLDPCANFNKLLSVWQNNPKFRILSGGTISYKRDDN